MPQSFFVFLSVCVFGVVLTGIVWSLLARWRHSGDLERRRLDVIEKALQHPNLDAATRTELLRTLAGPRGQRAVDPNLQRDWWPKLWFGAAWFLFVICGSLMIASGVDVIHSPRVEELLPFTLVGFAMLTLPAALRELARRGGAAPIGR